MKYIDMIAYPIMMGVIYVLFGIVNWQSDPEFWSYADRCVWVIWGLAWGYGLQSRIVRGGGA